eukprot:31020_1
MYMTALLTILSLWTMHMTPVRPGRLLTQFAFDDDCYCGRCVKSCRCGNANNDSPCIQCCSEAPTDTGCSKEGGSCMDDSSCCNGRPGGLICHPRKECVKYCDYFLDSDWCTPSSGMNGVQGYSFSPQPFGNI